METPIYYEVAARRGFAFVSDVFEVQDDNGAVQDLTGHTITAGIYTTSSKDSTLLATATVTIVSAVAGTFYFTVSEASSLGLTQGLVGGYLLVYINGTWSGGVDRLYARGAVQVLG